MTLPLFFFILVKLLFLALPFFFSSCFGPNSWMVGFILLQNYRLFNGWSAKTKFLHDTSVWSVEIVAKRRFQAEYTMGVLKVSFCTEHIESSCYRSHEPCSDTPYNHLHKCEMMKKKSTLIFLNWANQSAVRYVALRGPIRRQLSSYIRPKT